ncbi:hypothetical protein [Deinococcus cellulosilyticus]|uniref:Uncharacterized protein n=1 Tax=Deinococcus cellulosilyticus (strain DSM 18568 / NBRC 106333 / KACC 11606 / 5516J-15) TaxID=1223518 RepID=A0A511N1G0_DEIC1|nr:hypothetical protein [Deinococcus cellulosilyticus]GEM46730.1 hypothetical protein DC3_23650 [Deinococcus cellulosilyticus NBRC 106333 = KACC 11606]
MISTFPEGYTQVCVQEACREAMHMLREAHHHLRSHPQVAQLRLDRAYEVYLSALDRVRCAGCNSAPLERLLQRILEAQKELDPVACGDHALAVSIAREQLGMHRLHETDDPGFDLVQVRVVPLCMALNRAYRVSAWQDIPEALLQDHLFRLGFQQSTEQLLNPVQVGTALRAAIRQGRGRASQNANLQKHMA